MKVACVSRLNEIHDLELEDCHRVSRETANNEMRYKTHRLVHWLILAFAVLFVCSGSFIIGIVYTGAINGRSQLAELPRIIDKAGYRRTLVMSLMHWQREIYHSTTDSPLAYFNIVREY
jgi:hypothetical protein